MTARYVWEPSPVRRTRPTRGTITTLPTDIHVIGDPTTGLVDILVDPGGSDPIQTVRLTMDLVGILHQKLGSKLDRLHEVDSHD